ncbi:MAG: hypothetical protein ACP5N1_00125 [Candidatus Woesearchaeota archaeon]
MSDSNVSSSLESVLFNFVKELNTKREENISLCYSQCNSSDNYRCDGGVYHSKSDGVELGDASDSHNYWSIYTTKQVSKKRLLNNLRNKFFGKSDKNTLKDSLDTEIITLANITNGNDVYLNNGEDTEDRLIVALYDSSIRNDLAACLNAYIIENKNFKEITFLNMS